MVVRISSDVADELKKREDFDGNVSNFLRQILGMEPKKSKRKDPLKTIPKGRRYKYDVSHLGLREQCVIPFNPGTRPENIIRSITLYGERVGKKFYCGTINLEVHVLRVF